MSAGQLPCLFHIGTQKAGSTLLYNLLVTHPDVALSSRTEVNFYSEQYGQGEAWYGETFGQSSGVRIDTSPKYFMLGKEVAPRIAEHVGTDSLKFLLILRNPIDYLHSHFQMHRAHGFFDKHPEKFGRPSDDLVGFVRDCPAYLERAQYHHLLQPWLEHFSLDQFMILPFEEFVTNTDACMQRIEKFFGITQMSLTASSVSKNARLRHPYLYNIRGKLAQYKGLKAWLKRNTIATWVYNKLFVANSSSVLSMQERETLRNMLTDDVTKLKQLLGDHMDVWKDFDHMANNT